MKIFRNHFFKQKNKFVNSKNSNFYVDQYDEIAKLVKAARINKEISIAELSRVSKIPKYTINSIENNIENIRPKYPFIRSILFKLEECLSLEKNKLVSLLNQETKTYKLDKEKLILRKFDFINTWKGTVLYFLILVLIIFVLKKYFSSNVSIIEIQNIEQKINDK